MTALPSPSREVMPVSRFGEAGDDGAAVGLRSSSTMLGLHFLSVGAGALSIGGSDPLAGKLQLEGVWLQAGTPSVATDPHRFQFALASDVPSDQAGLDGGEQVFPRASNQAESKNTLVYFGDVASFFVPVTTLLKMNGRRIVCGWFNGGVVSSDGFVVLVLHRVFGGQGGGDPHFLAGEEVALR